MARPLGGCLYGARLAPGAVVDRYRIAACIGEGGCASVYRATDIETGAAVAVKLLHVEHARSSKMIARFRREAASIRAFDHPHIVDLFDVGCLYDGRPYFAMEWIEGGNLATAVARRGALGGRDILTVAEQLGAALGASHAAGIIHRDLKASNVLVADSAPLRVKLADFGVAKILEPGPDDPVITSDAIVGTPVAMSPEQILRKPVDRRTDVYGFGILLYHLATGAVPFDGDDYAEIERQHLHSPPPLPSAASAVPRGLDDLVARCMAKDPEARFDSIGDVVAALRAALADERVETAATGVHVTTAHDTDDADAALDRARVALEAAGFDVAFEASDGFLAILRGSSRSQRACAIAAAAACVAPQLSIRVHAGRVELGPTGPLGGDLFCLATWPPAARDTEILVSAELVTELGLPPVARAGLTLY